MDTKRVIDDMITAESVSPDEMMADFIAFDAQSRFDEPSAMFSKTFPEASLSSSPSATALHTTQSASKPQSGSTVSKIRQAQLHAVFIRIEKISRVVDDAAEDFRCNKRSLMWHDGDGHNVQVRWLIENPGPFVQVDVRPNGFGYPVTVHWDPKSKCFKGTNMGNRGLMIPWEELKEMVINPWARQYKGYHGCIGKD